MEINKYEAERCIELAKAALTAENLAKAEQLLKKSQTLYPLPEAELLLKRMNREAAYKPSEPKKRKAYDLNRTTNNGSGPGRKRPRAGFTYGQNEFTFRPDFESEGYPNDSFNIFFGGGFPQPQQQQRIERKHYKKLVLQVHPDKAKAPGSAEAYKIVNKVFATLSDDERRADYDSRGSSEGGNPPVDRARPSPGSSK
ncbi:dnaJ homolog subfamily B member 14-like [Anopheles cruzii]|uniref:dnaJ homolog subfamily B member 14-like n=1 Tax=Anopheles cruzii TaxID=68878 RepID=UPI0022EC206D|nr:dnaJ homolog subfamily B member 14-like [Anopheles cruzii]XP_052871350.1 dnaJ homolog subfamily B member 14-like [Anopheles cruzii]